jgi:hypothetical protein
MKKFYLLLLALGLFTGVEAQVVVFNYNIELKNILLSTSPTSSIAKDINGNNIKVDSNNDGEIQISEALNVYSLNIDNYDFNMNGPFGLGIDNLNGIEYFTNLTYLNCRSHTIDDINITPLINLVEFNCDYNYSNTLIVAGLSHLKKLSCAQYNGSTLNLSGLIALEDLNLFNSDISSLNLTPCVSLKNFQYRYNNVLQNLVISGLNNLDTVIIDGPGLLSLTLTNLPSLKRLYCTDGSQNTTNLVTLQMSGLPNLEELVCSYNKITALNLLGINKLKKLECEKNRIAGVLDVSDKKDLIRFTCQYNLLTGIIVKNGFQWTTYDIFFHNNPGLHYICAEDNQYVFFKNKVASGGVSPDTVEVNSYCSFAPGGNYYSIQGNIKLDANNNGCDPLDSQSNLKFNISNGTSNGIIISDVSGNYSIPLVAGTYAITPALENPTYFTFSPSIVNVIFPAQATPLIQNFCITPNGNHPDLEISLLPLSPARPGFDAIYKVVYKNKGNTTQSGTVNLVFNDAILEFITANPTTTSQTINNLSWSFTNLLPFESKEITLTLNLNSPSETPAVNAGNVLNYTTTITSPATDDLPNDNTFVYNQTVVNSFDPNDKTCLEGATITPTKVGDYVHYMIRFENNGTANAQNIVVKDMIDLAKFDINSIVPIKGSHSFVTNITAGNKVEFIFENINLPFDDANNDGFVAFKIKTKSTLVLGDTFTNNASIYFDYNFPIVTNTATTTIAALSVQDFVFSRYFSVYPNPVSDVLTISTKESIEVSSINIYNTLGQLVLVIPNAQNTKTVDVSSLTTGNYFIKINSDKGTSNTKFIKN